MYKTRIVLFLIAIWPCVVLADEAKQSGYPCSAETAAQRIVFGQGTFLICYFGSPPEQKADGWIYVAGVSFQRLVVNAKSRPEFIAEADELGLGIDYRFSKGKLEIVQYIDTYPDFKAVPFYVETIDLNKVPAVRAKSLVYHPKKVSRAEMDQAVFFLKINEAKYNKLYQSKHGSGLIYEHLFKLRDYAFIAPVDVAAELKNMEGYWWCNGGGEVDEVFHSIQHNVSVIAGLLPNPRRRTP